MKGLRLLAITLGLGFAATVAAQQPRLELWKQELTGFVAAPGAGDTPMPVGSLQKPFIAQAWTLSHPGEAPPRFRCEGGPACWLRGGHGELGLAEALSRSCNAYFRQLAEATPVPVIKSVFLQAGFTQGPCNATQAVGLAGEGPLIEIRPSVLLRTYGRLVAEPWAEGEEVRRQLLAGLREAALSGTASGLGHRGYWAKTGTVPDGGSLHTSGLALAVDDSGWAVLARLRPGTGSEAAMALADPLAQLRPGHTAHRLPLRRGRAPRLSETPREPSLRPVTVRLFDLVRPKRPLLRNLGTVPIPSGEGFLGAGATLELRPGDAVGPGLVELRDPGTGLRRRLSGLVHCVRGPRGTLRLSAVLSARDYVDGVVAAELPSGDPARRLELGAAVLRFLAHGPRHDDADVCDSTHCAWFVGRGPVTRWASPRLAESGADAPAGFNDEAWTQVVAMSHRPGPDQWTTHCGGHPLSGQELWGNGDTQTEPCLRHGTGAARSWTRDWSRADLAKAFGGTVRGLAITHEEGVWVLRVTCAQDTRSFRYDDAHRRLATALGWGALPSPADGVEPIEGGFRARGVGLGHRVGLCLED